MILKIFILYIFILKILYATIIEDELFTSNRSENLTFFYNGNINIKNVILFQSQYNIKDFNISILEKNEIMIIESKKQNIYFIFYSIEKNQVNVTIQIINKQNHQYNLTLSRFTNIIVNKENNITVNYNSNSPLIYNLQNLTDIDILVFTNFPHHLFYYNEKTKEITQKLNNLFLSFELNKDENIYLIAFPENSTVKIYFEISFFDRANSIIKINKITDEKNSNNEIKIDNNQENKSIYFFNSFISSNIKKQKYIGINVTYGSPIIYYNNISNQTSISDFLKNKINLSENDIKSSLYYDIFEIICAKACFFYLYYIDNDYIIKDKYITYFDIEEGKKNHTLNFSNELIEPGFYYNVTILNNNLKNNIILQLNDKEYNITNKTEKEIIIKHDFYQDKLQISSIKGNVYGIIFVFFDEKDISKKELKNGDSINTLKEITLYIEIDNNEKYGESFFREINIKNMDKDKNNTFCYTLQKNNNYYFKPSKYICRDDNDISLIYNNNDFQYNETLYYFFHSDNANYSYEYFIVSNFSLKQNNLTQINFELKKSLIEMIDIKNIKETDKYIFLQILKSNEPSITYKIFNKEIYTVEQNNYYTINLIENTNNENEIEIKGKCFFQYIVLKKNKNFTLPDTLSFNILNSNDSYIDISYDEFLGNENINYKLLIEKKDEKGFENLNTSFSVFNVILNNESYIKDKNYHLLELSYKKENNKLFSTIQIPELIKQEYLSEYYLNIIAQENDTKLYFTYIPLNWKINKVPELTNDKPIDFILRNNYQNLYLYTNTTIKQGEEGFFMIKLNSTNNSIRLLFSCFYYDSPNSIDKNILYRRNISNPKCVDFTFDDPNVIFIRYDFNTKNHTLVLMIYTNQQEIENLPLTVYKVKNPESIVNVNKSFILTNLSLPIIYKIDIKNFTKNQLSLISFVNKTNILKIFLGKVIGNGYKISKFYSTEIFGFDQTLGNSINYQCFNFFFFNFNNSKNITNDEIINFELRFLNSSYYNVFFQNYSKNNNSENYLINCNGKTQYIIRYNYDKDSSNEFILYPRLLYGDGEIYYNNPSFVSSINELFYNSTNNIKNIPLETNYKYSFFKVICNNNAFVYISQYIPNNNIKLKNGGDFIFMFLSESKQNISCGTDFTNNYENVKVQLYSNISNEFLINNETFEKDNKIQYFNISKNNNILISRKYSDLKEKILLSILLPLSDSQIMNQTYKDENMKEDIEFESNFYLINLKSPKSKSLLSHYRFSLINSKKEDELKIEDIYYNLEIANYPYIPSPIMISNINEFVKIFNNNIFLRIYTKEMNDENQNYFFIIKNIKNQPISITVSHSNEYYPKNNELIRVSSVKEGEISLIHQSIFVKLRNLHYLNFQVIPCKKQNTDFELYFGLKNEKKTKYSLTNNYKIEKSFLIYNGYGEFDIYGDAIFKHSIFFYKSIQNENQNNSFEIKVEKYLSSIDIKIPIESYAYSYYFTIYIAENNAENNKIFEDPCYLIEIASFNKSVEFFHKTIFKITDYNINEKEYKYSYNLTNQSNLIIRVLRNDSTIYGDLELSQIYYYSDTKSSYLIIVLFIVILILIIIIIIIYCIKSKNKEKSEGKILIIKQINSEFSENDEMNSSIL